MEIEKKGTGVIARFNCACGHTSPGMVYAAESFAASDRAAQEGAPCLACVLGMSPEELERRAQLSQQDRYGSYEKLPRATA